MRVKGVRNTICYKMLHWTSKINKQMQLIRIWLSFNCLISAWISIYCVFALFPLYYYSCITSLENRRFVQFIICDEFGSLSFASVGPTSQFYDKSTELSISLSLMFSLPLLCTFSGCVCIVYPEINESHDYLALTSDAKTIYFITRMNKTQFRNVTPTLLPLSPPPSLSFLQTHASRQTHLEYRLSDLFGLRARLIQWCDKCLLLELSWMQTEKRAHSTNKRPISNGNDQPTEGKMAVITAPLSERPKCQWISVQIKRKYLHHVYNNAINDQLLRTRPRQNKTYSTESMERRTVQATSNDNPKKMTTKWNR